MNLLYGDNGAGKTTVIESLVILAKGRSFRSGTHSSLIGPAAPDYLIRSAILDDSQRERRVALQRGRSRWEGRLDGEPLVQLSDTAECFPLILMEPTTHLLVSGPPDGRRRYLDWSVFHVKHQFLDAWRRYGRALKQRNAALRARDGRMVKTLDPQLISLAADLTKHRYTVFEALAPKIISALAHMSPEMTGLELNYQTGWQGDDFGEALEQGFNRDLEQGMTRSGPHRADIQLRIQGKAVRDRLSRGEQKVLAAAMCLAQGELFKDNGSTPLLLLDDLASEFDTDHLARVVETGRDLGAQLFITGTSTEAYAGLEETGSQVFHVKHGQITQE